MLNRLQTRLFLAFMGVLSIMMCVVASTFLLFLASRPVPVDGLLTELAAISLEVDPALLAVDLRADERRRTFNQTQQLAAFRTELDAVAAEHDVRLIVRTGAGRVLYDSAGRLTAQDSLELREEETIIGLESGRNLFTSGYFEEDRTEWIVATRRLRLNLQRTAPENNALQERAAALELLVGTPKPQQSLRRVLQEVGGAFWRSFCQAGLFGVLAALAVSYWMARSVARPLAALARAAQRVAEGDYEQKVPISGPTEARQVAEAFNSMTDQVRTNQVAQREFLANVTHELRTPLTSIQGFSQAIIDGVASQPESAQRAARVIYDESGRLVRLVNDLLDLARIQAGKMQMTRQAVELDRLLQVVSESLNLKAREKQIEF
ncbi:MAG: HAMP domain-containing protein, partial [Anaerolineae bacterium]|nr:HAMP domain-containing protein [Anaerolineae bacterium]